ncbi:F-box protein [Tetrabaena socialis]|uniref:F-box protein n=1 Tax=Tetrabaena socialis TaxID=47790 RepID=A0A2J8AB83_9CHLO|nr:F-box protein [Tetrabaena socialis]|eukprot:PNH09784.1 F-box protein [Tetrabaena socialis]
MEWHQPRDRLAIRAHIRDQLRDLLTFCDDDLEAARRAELVYLTCQRWREDVLRMEPQDLDGMLASTTDNHLQSIDNTLTNNDEFWSSTGSGDGTAGEALLYRLRQPLLALSYVTLTVYRAQYQHGDPLYPPHTVSFLTGPTPNQLYPASPLYPVRLTDAPQVEWDHVNAYGFGGAAVGAGAPRRVFALSPTAPVCRFLMVRLHGRLQQQWEAAA